MTCSAATCRYACSLPLVPKLTVVISLKLTLRTRFLTPHYLQAAQQQRCATPSSGAGLGLAPPLCHRPLLSSPPKHHASGVDPTTLYGQQIPCVELHGGTCLYLSLFFSPFCLKRTPLLLLHAATAAVRDIRVGSCEVVAPGPGEVLLRVGAVGLCGSDVHYYTHWDKMDSGLTKPQILGHEFSGTVAAVGQGVDPAGVFGVGTRVAVEPNQSCHRCECCHEGAPNMCSDLAFAGCGGTPGALRQYMTYKVRMCSF